MPSLTTPTLRSSGWFKYGQTNFITATEGTVASTITETVPAAGRLIPFRGWRSLSILPFGTDAENEDFTLMVMCVWKIGTFASHLPGYGDFNTKLDDQYLYQLYTTLKCVMNDGGTTGTAGAYIVATDFLCDTITITNDAYGTAIEAMTGRAGSAYSPGADGFAAFYHAPDLLSPDFVYLGFNMDGGDSEAASANCLCKLDA